MSHATIHAEAIKKEKKEKAVEEKAKKLGLFYINLTKEKVSPEALSLLPLSESLQSGAVVFFRIGKKIRIGITNENNQIAKNIIQRLKGEGFSLNICFISEDSLAHAQSFYEQKPATETGDIEYEEKETTAHDIAQNIENKKTGITEKKFDMALKDIHEMALSLRASDIHFQPEKETVKIRVRSDGMLQTLLDIPHKTYEGIVSQVKLQSHLKMGGKKLPQDGQYSFLVNKKTIDIRVSCMPGVFGESLVLRILDSRKGIVSLKDLGYETYQLEILAKILSFPYGMVLVAGPTGSGKTSTLYSLLKVLNTETRKILTLEDPVEYTFEGVFQSEITEEYSFFQGLKSALRQDPDIIMLGEIRDYEVALTAFQASQTGHFVLSSLHANSAIEVFSRLKNLEIPAYLITPSLLSVVSQRLLRTVCPHCSAKRPFTKEQKIFLEPFYTSFFSQGIFSEIFPEQEVYGKGCEECNFTGYKGRTVASEVLFVSDTLKEMVRSNASLKEFTEQAKKEGFIFMKENACLKVLQGKTSLEEVLRVFG